ncbi:MAG: (d)CMP kinase [Anaerolineales bacterium]
MNLNPERDSIIAVDGPAASGKSTLAQHLANHLGFLYFDTGVMYRAATLAGLQAGIPPSDEERITEMAFDISIDVRPPSKPDGRQYDVIVNGEDVTWELRSEAVDANVSEVSAYPGVRRAMTERQREIGRRGGVVMVGRDIGTIVLPEADLKLYLDASVEARAERRFTERLDREEEVEYEEVLESMRTRDRIDSSRDLAPLQPAEDAVIIDSTNLSIEEVLERALELLQG